MGVCGCFGWCGGVTCALLCIEMTGVVVGALGGCGGN